MGFNQVMGVDAAEKARGEAEAAEKVVVGPEGATLPRAEDEVVSLFVVVWYEVHPPSQL